MNTPYVQVKTKYQVTLPPLIRKKLGLRVGDMLETKVEGKKITFSPQSIIDREIALAMEDRRHGRGIGPFTTAPTAIRALHREMKKYQPKK